MDFGQILHTAKKNEHANKNGARYYSTKFEPPKKEKKTSVELSANIKKFLAKKEAEEKKKAEEDHKKREELLALRSQDKKATRRVNVMLKRTKSANQSVIEDAVDNDNTAVTLAGPMQPDEDDYGYVSQEASAFYNQMMEKYNKMPDEPKFDMTKKKVSTNLSSTKDRVRAALEREKEEAMMPHKRKRKHKEKEEDEDGVSYDAPDREPEDKEKEVTKEVPKVKPKPKMMPPPINFSEKEDEKLLTKRQRRDAEKEREFLRRREERRRDIERGRIPKKVESTTKLTNNGEKQISKSNKSSSADRIPEISDHPSAKSLGSSKPSTDSIKKQTQSDKFVSSKEKSRGLSTSGASSSFQSGKFKSKDAQKDRTGFEEEEKPGKKYLPGDLRYKPEPKVEVKPTKQLPEEARYKQGQDVRQKQGQEDVRYKQKQDEARLKQRQEEIRNKPRPDEDPRPRKYLPGDVRYKQEMEPKRFPPNDIISRKNALSSKNPSTETQLKKTSQNDTTTRKPLANGNPPKKITAGDPGSRNGPAKQFPPRDLKPLKQKQFPPPDVRRNDVQAIKKKPAIGNKRRILDDDSEYDSEMDDFIDDDEPEDDYSKYISEIFGYDKSRYRDVDDDVDNMESTFAQQMREEVISTKIGIMEDLEDIKKEEEEKKRKMQMKKRKK
ncbi:unnamed protein product [Phaedon cochleariae]|uniref:Protein SPT2 homolog n=1 Tax=Phaedon cochleariae TaxID=80249 RepID=A0A9N9SEZ3_PHACE|nr:unnamed protein product [Phaedon cochleariae]